MNQEQNNVSVDTVTDDHQAAEHSLCYKNQELREYYLRQLQLMCPTLTTRKPDTARLAILRQRTEQLIEMLTLFDRSWAEEVAFIQKACFSYLGNETLTRKERRQLIDAWTDWSEFMFRLSRHRGLLSHFLQYHHRIFQELESLLNADDSGTSPASRETTEEGGI